MQLTINKFKKLLKKIRFRLSDSRIQERKKKQDYEYLISHGVETEYGYVTLLGLPIISKEPNSRIIIGKGVTLVSDTKYNVAGINHPCILSTVRPGASLIIEDGSGVSGATISCASQIVLKKGVGLGANVCVYDHDFHGIEPYNRCCNDSIKSRPITIEEFVWIGANSVVLKGSTIGKAAVIGACSVVVSDVPELCVYAGNPAHFIKKIKVDQNAYNALYAIK